jgi:hypothetical protein
MDHDAFSRSGNSDKAVQDAYVLVNHIIAESYALLTAAEESAARRVVVFATGAMELDLNCHTSFYDPERALPNKLAPRPPKRFFRTFWRSITLRILDRSAHTARQSFKFVPTSVQRVA